MSHGKEIFDHALNALSALLGNDPGDGNASEEPAPARKQTLKALKATGVTPSFAGPSCCIAKRPGALGPGKLPKMRDPRGK